MLKRLKCRVGATPLLNPDPDLSADSWAGPRRRWGLVTGRVTATKSLAVGAAQRLAAYSAVTESDGLAASGPTGRVNWTQAAVEWGGVLVEGGRGGEQTSLFLRQTIVNEWHCLLIYGYYEHCLAKTLNWITSQVLNPSVLCDSLWVKIHAEQIIWMNCFILHCASTCEPRKEKLWLTFAKKKTPSRRKHVTFWRPLALETVAKLLVKRENVCSRWLILNI